VQGLGQARDWGLLNLRTFDIVDYDIPEKVETGDSTWIIPGSPPPPHFTHPTTTSMILSVCLATCLSCNREPSLCSSVASCLQ